MSDAFALAQFGFAAALASALVHSLWQDALLGAAAALTLRAMAPASAARRHAVAMTFLGAMALLPALQFLRLWGQAGGEIEGGFLPAMTAPRFSATAHAFVQETSVVAPLMVLVWLLGVVLMLVRHVAALRALTAVERGPYALLPPAWIRRVDEMRSAMRIGRSVAVRLSENVLTPFAARLLRPAIWLPVSLLTRTPPEQLEALLAHELAHIARKDWLWNGIQCLLECLFFFNPAVWWLGRRIRQERENACDDLAVAACGDAVVLAEALVALECDRHAGPRLILAAKGGSLMKRITRLLSGPPSRGRWGALALLGALSVSGLVVIAQVGIAGGLPDLNVEASTPGELGPGDYREITANGVDHQRFYRVSLDAQGRRTELYREDGVARPIDAGARRWIDGVTRLSLAPQHPAPPNLDATPEHAALFALIERHPAVIARLGTPVGRTSGNIDGVIRHDGTDGDADIRIELSGPRGRATAAVQAEMNDHAWTLQSVVLQ